MTETSLTFRIYSDELVPEHISEIIKVQPTRAHRRGHQYPNYHGITMPPAATGAWMLSSENAVDGGISEHAAWLLSQLAPSQHVIRALISENYSVDILCKILCHSNELWDIIRPDVLREFDELSVPLSLNIVFLPEPAIG